MPTTATWPCASPPGCPACSAGCRGILSGFGRFRGIARPSRLPTTIRPRPTAPGPAGSISRRTGPRGNRGSTSRRWSCTRPIRGITCSSRCSSRWRACPSSARSTARRRMSRAGRCMPSRSAERSACTTTMPAASGPWKASASGPGGSSWTPACTPWAGLGSRPSTFSAMRARSIATSLGRARHWPTRWGSSRSWNCERPPAPLTAPASMCATSTTQSCATGRSLWRCWKSGSATISRWPRARPRGGCPRPLTAVRQAVQR